MHRVIRTSLTLGMSTLIMGFAVSQARAERVGYMPDRCFGEGCVTGSARMGALSLAYTDSSLTPILASTVDLSRALNAAGSGMFSVNNVRVNSITRPSTFKEADANPVSPGHSVSAAIIPEPTTMLLLGTGLVGAAAVMRRRLKARTRQTQS